MFHVKQLPIMVILLVNGVSGYFVFSDAPPDVFALVGHGFFFLVNIVIIVLFFDCLLSWLNRDK